MPGESGMGRGPTPKSDRLISLEGEIADIDVVLEQIKKKPELAKGFNVPGLEASKRKLEAMKAGLS